MALSLETPHASGIPEPMVERLRLTPEDASALLASDLYARQRPLRKWHVDELALAIARGRFKPGTIEVCEVAGARYLVDGQHRLHAVVKAGIPQTFTLHIYPYHSLEQVEDHYDITDVGMKRLPVESPALAYWASSHGFHKRDVRGIISAAMLLKLGFMKRPGGTPPVSMAERMQVIRDFTAPLRAYFDAIHHAERAIAPRLRLGGVVAVGAVLMRDQKEKARPFFEHVAALAGYEPGGGEAYLIGWFMERSPQGSRPEETARYVARAWNAHFDGGRLRQYRDVDTTAPIRIAGTIYDGKTVRTL